MLRRSCVRTGRSNLEAGGSPQVTFVLHEVRRAKRETHLESIRAEALAEQQEKERALDTS